jgi:hypothetical protein
MDLDFLARRDDFSVLHSAQFVAAREERFQAVGQAILPAAAFQAGFGCGYAAWWDRRFRLSRRL